MWSANFPVSRCDFERSCLQSRESVAESGHVLISTFLWFLQPFYMHGICFHLCFSDYDSVTLLSAISTPASFAYNTAVFLGGRPAFVHLFSDLIYCHVSGVCVTNKTGFGFDDRIYWTFIQPVTRVHKSLSDLLSTSSDWALHGNYPDLTELNWTELNWTELSIIVGLSLYSLGSDTVQKTHPLPSNGYMRAT
jgi:hypothetical protein